MLKLEQKLIKDKKHFAVDLVVGKKKEVGLQEKDGAVQDFKIMRSKGLGDSIEKFTKATGIIRVVNKVSEGLNIPCGCEGRRDAMNILFPYNKKK